MDVALHTNYFYFYVLDENMCFLEIFAMNFKTIGKMVRSLNEMSSPKCNFDTNEFSALLNFYLHPMRFVGTRVEKLLFNFIIFNKYVAGNIFRGPIKIQVWERILKIHKLICFPLWRFFMPMQNLQQKFVSLHARIAM